MSAGLRPVRRVGCCGRDHFDTPSGAPRHLFAQPGRRRRVVQSRVRAMQSQGWRTQCSKAGYDRDHCSFPRSRMFETETEFYESHGGIDLQIEAKASASETAALAAAIEMHGTLTSLPRSAVKEIGVRPRSHAPIPLDRRTRFRRSARLRLRGCASRTTQCRVHAHRVCARAAGNGFVARFNRRCCRR